MKQTTNNQWLQRGIQIYSTILLFVFIASCNEEQNKNLSEVKVESPINENSNIETLQTDPLFYIDGQLCQHLRKIFQDKNGDLWFGTNVYGLMRYNGDTLEYFSDKEGLPGGRITGIVEDEKGNIWFGSYGGLTKYDGKSFTNFS